MHGFFDSCWNACLRLPLNKSASDQVLCIIDGIRADEYIKYFENKFKINKIETRPLRIIHNHKILLFRILFGLILSFISSLIARHRSRFSYDRVLSSILSRHIAKLNPDVILSLYGHQPLLDLLSLSPSLINFKVIRCVPFQICPRNIKFFSKDTQCLFLVRGDYDYNNLSLIVRSSQVKPIGSIYTYVFNESYSPPSPLSESGITISIISQIIAPILKEKNSKNIKNLSHAAINKNTKLMVQYSLRLSQEEKITLRVLLRPQSSKTLQRRELDYFTQLGVEPDSVVTYSSSESSTFVNCLNSKLILSSHSNVPFDLLPFKKPYLFFMPFTVDGVDLYIYQPHLLTSCCYEDFKLACLRRLTKAIDYDWINLQALYNKINLSKSLV